MKIIKRLESSVNSLIEVHTKLRKERDNALKESQHAQKELQEAKETIKGLRLSIGSNQENNNRGLEVIKKEIIAKIQSILSRLENVANIDDITNNTG